MAPKRKSNFQGVGQKLDGTTVKKQKTAADKKAEEDASFKPDDDGEASDDEGQDPLDGSDLEQENQDMEEVHDADGNIIARYKAARSTEEQAQEDDRVAKGVRADKRYAALGQRGLNRLMRVAKKAHVDHETYKGVEQKTIDAGDRHAGQESGELVECKFGNYIYVPHPKTGKLIQTLAKEEDVAEWDKALGKDVVCSCDVCKARKENSIETSEIDRGALRGGRTKDAFVRKHGKGQKLGE